MKFRLLNKILATSLALIAHGCIFADINTTVIIGNYVQAPGTTLSNEIAVNGTTDQLSISGTATLTGSNVQIIAEPGVYLKGTNYTFLTAQGGIIGKFATLTEPGNLYGSLFYFQNNVSYLLEKNVVGGYTGKLCGNAGRVRSYLGDIIIAPGTDLYSALVALNALDPSEKALKKALNEISPAQYGGLPWANAAVFHLVRAQFSQRNTAILNEECSCEDNGIWLSGVGEILQQEHMNELIGFHANTYGVIGGFDRRISNAFSLGLGGGYTHTNLRWKPSRGHHEIESGFLGLYNAFAYQGWLFDLSATGVWQHHHSLRRIDFPSVHRHASSSYDGSAVIAHLGTAYDWRYYDFDVQPFIGVDYYYTTIDGFKESGAGDLNFRVKRQHGEFIRTELGIGFQTDSYSNSCYGNFVPYAGLSWVCLTPLHNNCISSRLVGREETLSLHTTEKTLNFIVPSVGVVYKMGNNVEVGAGYEGEFSKERQDHNFNVNASYLF